MLQVLADQGVEKLLTEGMGLLVGFEAWRVEIYVC
jgi:hypothetical protein